MEASAARGFILEPTYRMESGRPVVHLWGVLEDGTSFLVRDRRAVPGFFVRAADAARAHAAGCPLAAPTALRTMAGDPVVRVDVAAPPDVPGLRERLERAGIEAFEADVRFAMRYLLDRGIRGALAVTGPWTRGDGVGRIYDDPEVAPAEIAPSLRVLSLDIETDPTASRVFSVALHGPGVAEVLLVPGGKGALPPYASEVADERALLAAFATRVRAIDPDVLTGWNVIGFDLQVLERRARALGVPLALGRGSAPLRVRIDRSFWQASRAEVEGRVVLDGADLLRGAFVRVEDYRLDTVARALLGEGKTLETAGRAAEIERRFREDREGFCAYNLKDAELVTRILDRTGVVRLAIKRSLLTGMPLDRVSASIASFDALYLPELRRRGIVAPSVRGKAPDDETEPTAGGAVLEPVAGLHDRVLVFDFKSLYPTLMRTFNIDPLTFVRAPGAREDVIRTPSGAAFAREPGILPALLARLMEVRERARRDGDAIASQATKILMNSFYGVLATPACRFHSTAVANAITHTGQALLYWTKARVEELGHRVLYGDTDSLFVAAGTDADVAAREAGRALVGRLNRELAEHLAAAYGVESRLELEFEGLYLKLFFPHMRHAAQGARKRYAGLLDDPEGRREIVFVGMESVRRDWTEAAKEFQRGLYERLFAGEPLAAFMRDFVRSVRTGERDPGLVYKKSLRKDVEAYTATTPPHVKAARIAGDGARLVEYVMTAAGPEPLGTRTRPLDHEHYVEKQLRPIAEAVLPLVDIDWDELVGNPRQLKLF